MKKNIKIIINKINYKKYKYKFFENDSLEILKEFEFKNIEIYDLFSIYNTFLNIINKYKYIFLIIIIILIFLYLKR